jgi:UDP-glucose 4-epimerase
VAVLTRGQPGEVYNIGGGHRQTLKNLFPVFESITGRNVRVNWDSPQKGDVSHTSADISKAARDLDYRPQTTLEAGLTQEWLWIRNLYA